MLQKGLQQRYVCFWGLKRGFDLKRALHLLILFKQLVFGKDARLKKTLRKIQALINEDKLVHVYFWGDKRDLAEVIFGLYLEDFMI